MKKDKAVLKGETFDTEMGRFTVTDKKFIMSFILIFFWFLGVNNIRAIQYD